MINLIACMGKNYVIGKDNDMPWGRGLPADLNYFKECTVNKTVVMGRKTYESIIESLGKPLPNRKTIVLTRQNIVIKHAGVIVCNSIEEVLEKHNEEELFIVGGANIYEQFMKCADRLYLTKIDEEFDGDAYFPTFDLRKWELMSYKKGLRDEQNKFNYGFFVYEK